MMPGPAAEDSLQPAHEPATASDDMSSGQRTNSDSNNTVPEDTGVGAPSSGSSSHHRLPMQAGVIIAAAVAVAVVSAVLALLARRRRAFDGRQRTGATPQPLATAAWTSAGAGAGSGSRSAPVADGHGIRGSGRQASDSHRDHHGGVAVSHGTLGSALHDSGVVWRLSISESSRPENAPAGTVQAAGGRRSGKSRRKSRRSSTSAKKTQKRHHGT
jgi:hypothetical protein